MTAKVGLIGYPIKHSISPQFQQAAFDYYGLDTRYELWEVDNAGLPDLVTGLRAPDKLGANVTVPHKEAVLPLVDELDPLAQRIGAVNTIVNREGALAGHNTDARGFLRALREEARFEPAGKRVVVLGAGGAARGVAFALAGAGVKSLAIINRSRERAEGLAAALAPLAEALPWSVPTQSRALRSAELIVNCTSIGMRHGPTEGRSPVPSEVIPRKALVFDIVYNPLETPLLREAKKAGAATLGGLSMLVYQGAASFELWTRRQAPLEVMFEAARKALGA
ncbi:MAG: shikimate dehydrogenase [Chloroflexi bacterium]|nr:shikimate dehydrogenase [Chloroflexota bacterium]